MSNRDIPQRRCPDEMGCKDVSRFGPLDGFENTPSASRLFALSEQSSSLRVRSPCSGHCASAAAIYSTDFLSRAFCDKSRNCKDLACRRLRTNVMGATVMLTFETYAPIRRNAGVLRRRLEATERKERDLGMRREWSMGFNTCDE